MQQWQNRKLANKQLAHFYEYDHVIDLQAVSMRYAHVRIDSEWHRLEHSLSTWWLKVSEPSGRRSAIQRTKHSKGIWFMLAYCQLRGWMLFPIQSAHCSAGQCFRHCRVNIAQSFSRRLNEGCKFDSNLRFV